MSPMSACTFWARSRIGSGLTAALSAAVLSAAVVHNRGKVFVQAALMLACGGQCCAATALRAERNLFGQVPSDSTLYRTMQAIDGPTRDAIAEAGSRVCVGHGSRAWG